MSPRCMAMLPVSEGHPKQLRCSGRGACRVRGLVLCKEHRPPSKPLTISRKERLGLLS